MKLESGRLVLERRDCHWCDRGKRPGTKRCDGCGGTGAGKRGKPRGCRHCCGSQTQPDFDNPVVCNFCGGNWRGSVLETVYDYLPDAIWRGLPFRVYREDVPLTYNESYLGLGTVFSCTDYGAAWNANDDAALIASVKAHGGHQACKVAQEDGTLCDHVAIIVKPGGYVVRAVWAAERGYKIGFED